MIEDFTQNLANEYSPLLDGLVKEETYQLFQEILNAYHISWGPNIVQNSTNTSTSLSSIGSQYVSLLSSSAKYFNQSYSTFVDALPHSNWSSDLPLSKCFQSAANVLIPAANQSANNIYVMTHFDKQDETLIIVAHKLHYISISILAVLCILVSNSFLSRPVNYTKSSERVVIILVIVIVVNVFVENDEVDGDYYHW